VNDVTSKLKRSRLEREVKFDLYYKLTTNKRFLGFKKRKNLGFSNQFSIPG